MTNGYNNTGLDINLSDGTYNRLHIEDGITRQHIGGRGFGVYYLTKELSPQTDPLSGENLIIVSSGGLGGSITPSNARFSVTFKSPLTNTISSANSGGSWGVIFNRTGYDVAIIRGKADAPVYLYISEKRVEIIECGELWGKSISELTGCLQEKHSKTSRILGIGPAGENLVLFASMMNEKCHAVGRGGSGAVMGSKNLKAIVVEGNKRFTPADNDLYRTGIYQANKLMRNMPVTSKALPLLGTAGLVKLISEHDMLPHNNFRDTEHPSEGIEKISGEYLRKKIFTGKKSCFNCAIACSRKTKVGQKTGEGPEYETIGMMGANLGIYDIEELAHANYACNEAGLDTISFGNTVGLLMELYERNMITREDTGGIELRFGTGGILEKLIRLTVLRKDMGNEIAQGALRIAEKFGVPQLAMVVKGLELPAYDPRASLLQALGYATSSRGGCHLKGGYGINLGFFGGPRQVDRFLVDTVAGHIANLQDSGCIADSLGICRFAFFSINENELSRIYSGFTGVDTGPDDLQQAARNTQDLERLFNNGVGFTKKDDTLPDRFFSEKILIDGRMRAIDREIQFNKMLDKYYEIRNWNEDGFPGRMTD